MQSDSDTDGFRSDASRSPRPINLGPAPSGEPPARARVAAAPARAAPGYLGLVVSASLPHSVQEVPPRLPPRPLDGAVPADDACTRQHLTRRLSPLAAVPPYR